jgi:hypothetical protein
MPIDSSDAAEFRNASQVEILANSAPDKSGILEPDQRSEHQWRILEATRSSIADFT